MRCEKVEKLLHLYQDNQLNEKQRKEVEEHLKVCPECSKKLADLQFIQAEAKKKQIPQPPQDYWESFAWRVREKIEKKSKVSFGQRFYFFLKSIFSYSPAKIKWATAVASVLLVFVAVKLFMSYEKVDITTVQPKIKTEKISAPTEAPKVKALEHKKDIGVSEKKEVVSEKKAPRAVEAPLEEAIPVSGQLGSVAITEEKGVQKEITTDEMVVSDKEEKVLKRLPVTTAELKEKEEGYMATQEAPTISISDTVIGLAEKPQIQADVTTARKDSLNQEESVREFINKWRKFTQEKPQGQEKDKGYLNMSQGYLRLYDVASDKDKVLKEAVDSLKVYKDSTTTNTYKDSINRILIKLESLHKK